LADVRAAKLPAGVRAKARLNVFHDNNPNVRRQFDRIENPDCRT
jgi:hypothetical protein